MLPSYLFDVIEMNGGSTVIGRLFPDSEWVSNNHLIPGSLPSLHRKAAGFVGLW